MEVFKDLMDLEQPDLAKGRKKDLVGTRCILKSLPSHPIPHPLDVSIHFAANFPASLGWEHPALGEAWPELEEGFFFVLPSQGTIYKHHRYPPIKIRVQDWVCLAQGSYQYPEFPSISRLLHPAGSAPFPGACSYFWMLWAYQQSFTGVLFLFPLPIPALLSWFRTVM